MSLRHVLVAVTMLAGGLAAHADSYNFSLNGQGGGFSGTGTLTVSSTATAGQYTVTGISGSGTSGPIAPNGFNGNDNLFFTTGSYFDTKGLSFYDQNPGGVFQVRLYSVAGSYFADYNEIFTTGHDSGTLPVTFTATAATPEPSSLFLLGTGALGVLGAARRRLFA